MHVEFDSLPHIGGFSSSAGCLRQVSSNQMPNEICALSSAIARPAKQVQANQAGRFGRRVAFQECLFARSSCSEQSYELMSTHWSPGQPRILMTIVACGPGVQLSGAIALPIDYLQLPSCSTRSAVLTPVSSREPFSPPQRRPGCESPTRSPRDDRNGHCAPEVPGQLPRGDHPELWCRQDDFVIRNPRFLASTTAMKAPLVHPQDPGLARALRNRYWYRDGCPAGHGGCRDEMGAHNQENPDDPAYSSLPAPTSGVTPVTRVTRASENSWVRDTRHLVGLLESELLRYLLDTSGYLRYHGVLTGGRLSRCLQRSLPPGQGSLLQQQAASR